MQQERPEIIMIASMTRTGAIGDSRTNDLIKSTKEDLKLFKQATMGNVVVMGRNTWDSLPLKPLPDRLNIILSGSLDQKDLPPGVEVYPHMKALERRLEHIQRPVFIIGGGLVYKQFMSRARRLILSVWYDPDLKGDIFFPRIGPEFISTFRQDKGDFFISHYERE